MGCLFLRSWPDHQIGFYGCQFLPICVIRFESANVCYRCKWVIQPIPKVGGKTSCWACPKKISVSQFRQKYKAQWATPSTLNDWAWLKFNEIKLLRSGAEQSSMNFSRFLNPTEVNVSPHCVFFWGVKHGLDGLAYSNRSMNKWASHPPCWNTLTQNTAMFWLASSFS